ncbi:MAG TPA: NADH-quinone oxidoreductase subunit NuoF [Chloroflexi bacterium]|nr:NADH-quinone oxidoreductase subunit NuoF [Chloroflexota bacterium]
MVASRDLNRTCVTICGGTGCRVHGSEKVIDGLRAEISRNGIDADVRMTGCHGFCEQGPVVVIQPQAVFYRSVKPEDVPDIVHRTVARGEIIERLLYSDPVTGEKIIHEHEIPFYAGQTRYLLNLNGLIDPTSIEDYIAVGGYRALAKVLDGMSPEEVIEEVSRAGLRGRGGAGFPTALKWKFCRDASGDVKYVVCNADEGDPGAYMDRSIVEGDPHRVLEGMIIGAYAIGAAHGFVYIRAEYPLAVKHLGIALEQAREYGLLGENILGSGFDFDVEIRMGAGAFVCGEETALMASIEGKIGEPRPRPPFPAQSGLWGQPTNINNVKSWANVPLIIEKGADWYASVGTENSKGTKIFSMVGKINNTGLVEVPMGISLRELIYDIGGGIPGGKAFKAAQIGGPSGGCIPAEHLDVPIDYESLTSLGAIMGSGGLVITDEDTCMVDLARYFMSFTQEESCGKCVPCRVGTKAMLATLERICAGQGQPGDIEYLEELAQEIKASSLCGLGQTAPNPVLTTIRYFRDEYEAHIREHRCPAGVCSALVRAKCTNACPAEVDVPSYVSLVAQGRYAEALEVHRRRNPFALVCGRVCPAFCETKCRRAELDQPVAIRQIKRFMADHELERPWTPPRLEEPKAEKVAVIGAGPAGLTAALRLAQKGYPVTVFEALPVAGGMMAVGIPEYRLPRDVLNVEIENIKRAGVEIRLNTALGKDFTLDDLLPPPASPPKPALSKVEGLGGTEGRYKAVILTIGAHRSRELRIEGEEMEGVYHGVKFLRDIALGTPPDLRGKRVAVVGGGDVAIDAVRSAWRLGAAEVHLVYRRSRADMPARDEEVEAAEKEGIQFHFLTNPSRVIGNGKVTGVELLRQELGAFDVSGRRRPVPIPGSEFTLDVDVLIPAIGQEPDLAWMGGDATIETGHGATFVVNKGLATTRRGVFAAGDAVLGPATVIQAVAQGNRVADTVDNYLRTGSTELVVVKPGYEVVEQQFDLEQYAEATRPETRELPIEERRGNFDEVELPFSEETVQEECKRCLRCDLEWLETMGLEPTPVPERVLVVERGNT